MKSPCWGCPLRKPPDCHAHCPRDEGPDPDGYATFRAQQEALYAERKALADFRNAKSDAITETKKRIRDGKRVPNKKE